MRSLSPILAAIASLLPGAAAGQGQSGAGLASYVYQPCAAAEPATIVAVAGAPCAEAEDVAGQVLAAAPDGAEAALRAVGWTLVRARASDGGSEHDLVATRRGAALRIRRPGPAPDVDGWEAGR